MDSERSTEVLEKYKRRKINKSVFSRIHSLLQKFDEEERFDRRLAWIGVVAIVVLLVIAIYLW